MNCPSFFLLLPVTLLFGACAGDVHTTEQSPAQPSRYVATSRTGSKTLHPGRTTTYQPSRVYQITRVETANSPRGEWRALGENIEEKDGTLTFVAIGANRGISLTGSYQVTPMRSKGDRTPSQLNSEVPNSDLAPAGTQRVGN